MLRIGTIIIEENYGTAIYYYDELIGERFISSDIENEAKFYLGQAAVDKH